MIGVIVQNESIERALRIFKHETTKDTILSTLWSRIEPKEIVG